MTPSLRAVAEAAGVSVSSVSNAYNRPEQLSAGVRERILATARELGYPGPNPAARSLRTNQVGAIGVLLTTPLSYVFSDPYCIELLRGISEVTAQGRIGLVLLPQVDADAVRQAVIDGAISDGLDDGHDALQALVARGLPLARSVDSEIGRCVIVDDRAAGRQVGEHLAGLGHHDVAFVVGSADEPGSARTTTDEESLYAYSRLRLGGLRDGLGDPAQVRIIRVGGNSVEAGRTAAEHLLQDGVPRPSAIATDSDVLATGVLDVVRSRGLVPGQDISVTGFDDLPIAEKSGLTTVRQPIREKGRQLARALLDPEATERRTVLSTALVPRASTGPAASPPTDATDRPQDQHVAATSSAGAEWQIDDLDLMSYLRRVDYRGDRAPTVQTLTALHRAHVATFPFENLDVILGRGIKVDLNSIQTKLVYRQRGGYCYEQNLLFAAALERLGFTVSRWLARTGDPLEEPRPHSHLVLGVRSGDQQWLADVGFGSGLLEPILLADTGAIRQGDWTFQVTVGPDAAWRLRELRNGAWSTRYTFTDEPQFQVDMEMANHNTSTHPRSPFVQRPIVLRKRDADVQALIGRDFTIEDADHTLRQERVSDAEFADLLATRFGLPLTEEELANLVAFGRTEDDD